MNITNLDYIVPTSTSNRSARRSVSRLNSTIESIKGGFGMATFVSRASSFGTEGPGVSPISLLDCFPEGYFESHSPYRLHELDEATITHLATTGPATKGKNRTFQSVAGSGYLSDGGIFSFSSSASQSTL